MQTEYKNYDLILNIISIVFVERYYCIKIWYSAISRYFPINKLDLSIGYQSLSLVWPPQSLEFEASIRWRLLKNELAIQIPKSLGKHKS